MSIFYISTTGSDTTGDGSIGNPYLSIEKCITVGVDGDTVKALNGTYTITSTIDVSKQISIISNSGVATDVIFDANCTIFNIQSSNVSITYVTCQSSSTSELITIDRMSTGTTVPTFWTGITISNCILKYTGTALALNGTFTVNTNAFSRQGGTNTVDVIKLYSCRGTSSISSNTMTDSESIRYFTYLTSMGSGTYLDRCNSKGGTLTINSNNLTYTNGSQSMTFIFQDYFNQYNYGSIGANEQYNANTKLSGSFSSNTITSDNVKCKFGIVNILNNIDLDSLGLITIIGNTLNNTDYGVLHLDKNTSSHSVVSLANIVTRSMFKIYSNTLDTVSPYAHLEIHFDSSDTSTLFQDVAGTIPAVNLNDPVRCWKMTSLCNGSGVSATVSDTLLPKINTFTTGKTAVDFNSGIGAFGFLYSLANIENATLLIVLHMDADYISHPWNTTGTGWINHQERIVETFYTNEWSGDGFSVINYGLPRNVYFIYAVSANSATGTKCYTYIGSTLTNVGNVSYGTHIKIPAGHFLGGKYQGAEAWNKFKLAELLVYRYAMNTTELTEKMSELKTKWSTS